MAKESRRRTKVIKAMIAFVIILALLTFFSNTIMNLTIPKVMGSYASRGNLSYSNSARGQITVDNQTEVKGLEGRTVEQVMVTNYDLVEKGDTILTLKTMEDSEELQTKRDSLLKLERTAEYEARSPSSEEDYSTYYDQINSCKETLSVARAKSGFLFSKIYTVSKYPIAIMIPGIIPAINSLLTDCSAKIA